MPLPPLTAIVTVNACAVVIFGDDGVTVTVGVIGVVVVDAANDPTAVRTSCPPPPVSIIPVAPRRVPDGTATVPVGLPTLPDGVVRDPAATTEDRPVSVQVPLTFGAWPVVANNPDELRAMPFNPDAVVAPKTLLAITLPLPSYCCRSAP